MICAWMVTSSAVVGLVGDQQVGSLAIAMAITARCRMPPENSCGYWVARSSGMGIETRRSSSTARSRACDRADLRLVDAHRFGDLVADSSASGLSAVIGSWKISRAQPANLAHLPDR